MTDLLEVKKEIEDKWIAEDGLMRLDLQDDREPYPGAARRTVVNDNGILFTAYFHMLCEKHDILEIEVKSKIRSTIISLFSRHIYCGLSDRNSHRDNSAQSHDNMLVICVLSKLWGLDFAEKIVDHGLDFWWTFDNLNPGKINFKRWRHPGDRCIYYLAASKQPTLVQVLWLSAANIISAYKDHTNSSEHLLNYLRYWFLDDCTYHFIGYKCRLLEHTFNFWYNKQSKKIRKLNLQPLMPIRYWLGLYFKPEHPIHKLAEGL